MDGTFGILVLLLAIIVALILGVIAFARTYALQREIATLRRSLQTTERPEQAPSIARPGAEAPQPMAYSYDAPPAHPEPIARPSEPLPRESITSVSETTQLPTLD